MRPAAYLEITDLTHGYGPRAVLDRVSFNAAAGEVVCLLGRSGCGKTTMLRLIAGLERPQSGRIIVGGQELSGPATFVPPEQRGIGMMFQDYALFPHLTTYENAIFGRKASGATATALLTRVGLAHTAHRYPHTLSAGEQQRAALVRALVAGPSLLLMDEPFSNLDAGTRDDVRRMTLGLLRETQTTAVIVTHDPEEAMMLADRIVLLHDGRVEQVGTPAELYRSPRSLFAARYFSDLNELPGDAGPAYIRPHDIALVADATTAQFRVVEISYTGENTLITLAGPADRAPLKASVRGNVSLRTGDEVGVSYAPADLITFSNHHATTPGR